MRDDAQAETGDRSYAVALMYVEIGEASEHGRNYEASLEACRKVNELFIELNGPLQNDSIISLQRMALLHRRLGETDEADRLYDVVLDRQRELRGNRHVEVAITCWQMSRLHYDLMQFERAEELAREAQETLLDVLDEDHRYTANGYDQLGRV